jgi:hypothetical protein
MCQVLPTRRPAGLDERTLAYPRPAVKGEPLNLVVVLPLKPGVGDRARDLLRRAPPAEGSIQAYVTDEEVVFLLETDADVDELIAAWGELSAGPPRVAEGAYSWLIPHPTDEAFFTPTPGPGDSDGGDLYEPEPPK